MNKENDENGGKCKQTSYKILMSNFLGEKECTQLKHRTLACKLEGLTRIKMCLEPCRRYKSKSKQGKEKNRKGKIKVKVHKMVEINSNVSVGTININELNSLVKGEIGRMD